MRIATFNIESLDLPVEPRAAVLRPALERIDADVLCLQEVNGQPVAGRRERAFLALEALIAGTRYESFALSASHMPGRAGPADVHNLVTLSRYPVRATRQLRHDLVPPLDLRLITADPSQPGEQRVGFDRPVLVTEIDAPCGRLTVINVHLRAPIASAIPGQKAGAFVWKSSRGWAEGYALSGYKRIGQALEIRLAVDALFDADTQARILVAGDFNAEANETPLRLLAATPEDTGNTEHAARALVVLDRAIEASRRFSVVHHGRAQMLDHILASHAMLGRLREVEIHNEALGDEAIGYAKGVEAMGSYHAALIAEFHD